MPPHGESPTARDVAACMHALAIMGVHSWADESFCISTLQHTYPFTEATVRAAVQQRQPQSKAWPTANPAAEPSPAQNQPRRKRRIPKAVHDAIFNAAADTSEPVPVTPEVLDNDETDVEPRHRILDCIIALCESQVPLSAGAPTARAALRESGYKFGNDIIAAAIRERTCHEQTAAVPR